MNRDQKAATIEEIAAQIEGADAIFAVDYRGISVPQAAELRSKLREADASFRVVKNRLTKLAAKQAGEERLDEFLEGPTALTFVRGDTALAAKTLSNFHRETDVLTFKGGFMDGLSLDEERFKSIARLPGRDVLNGQLAGMVASPITGLVRGLGSMIQGLALQLGQIAEKGLVSGDAPAESAAGPVAEEGTSSSQASEEEPPTAPPADEAEVAPDEEPEADEEPSKPEDDETSSAEDTSEEASQSDSSPSSEGEPGTEQDEADSHTPAGEAEDVGGSGEETSDSEDDESKEEE
jgi:large subunit ribosomal protein L10